VAAVNGDERLCAAVGGPDEVEVRVSDSTAMVRYLVLPQRPPHTENFSENENEYCEFFPRALLSRGRKKAA
jgi:Nitrile hydratase, alpha chain